VIPSEHLVEMVQYISCSTPRVYMYISLSAKHRVLMSISTNKWRIGGALEICADCISLWVSSLSRCIHIITSGNDFLPMFELSGHSKGVSIDTLHYNSQMFSITYNKFTME
jgi:hypothetical protein